MRRVLLAFVVILSGCAAKHPRAPLAATTATFGWFGDLAGDCWTGRGADDQIVDRHCYEWQYGRFLRGSIAMKNGASGDSVFTWDPDTRQIRYWFWASDGSSGEAAAFYEGAWLRFPVPGDKNVRTSWQRLDADSFRVLREVKESGIWQQTQAVNYRRDL